MRDLGSPSTKVTNNNKKQVKFTLKKKNGKYRNRLSEKIEIEKIASENIKSKFHFIRFILTSYQTIPIIFTFKRL